MHIGANSSLMQTKNRSKNVHISMGWDFIGLKLNSRNLRCSSLWRPLYPPNPALWKHSNILLFFTIQPEICHYTLISPWGVCGGSPWRAADVQGPHSFQGPILVLVYYPDRSHLHSNRPRTNAHCTYTWLLERLNQDLSKVLKAPLLDTGESLVAWPHFL